MREVFKKAIECEDGQVKNNIIRIMAECCVTGINAAALLDMEREINSELDDCHFNEDMALLYLKITNSIHCKESALDYYIEVSDTYDLNKWDFCVLWAEMEKKHGEKIRTWFPKINQIDFEWKLLDECISFLKNGGIPFRDINI